LNDGVLIPVTADSDADGKVWRISPPSPWRENSTVAIQISNTAYGLSGALLLNPFSAKFSIVRTAANDSPSNGMAAIEVSRAAVDLRFAEPRDRLPGEPFGLRLGQQRIPARLEQLGEAWFRLTPDTPLDPALPYYLMAGPGVEIPLRFTNDAEPKTTEGLDSILAAQQEENGFIRVQLKEKTRRFRIDRRTLVLLDENGRATPHQATLTSDGRTIVIEPYSRAVFSKVILGGISIGVVGSRR